MRSEKPYLVITPPPTPNGSLHVGHVGGPYLRADLFVRLRTALGFSATTHLSHIDSYQTYISKKAREIGRTPEQLLRENTAALQADWSSLGVTPQVIGDNTAPSYLTFLRTAVAKLEATCPIMEATVGWCAECRLAQVESFAQGTCRNCLHNAYLNVCENCSLPQLGAAIKPHCTGCRRNAEEQRPAQVLDFTAAAVATVAALMAGRADDSRRAAVLFRALGPHQLLWSYPGQYGFRLADGRLLNPWLEIFIHHLYCVLQQSQIDTTAAWSHQMAELAEVAPTVAYFFGVDNTYYYTFAFTYLAAALGAQAMIPRQVKVNAFMTLGGAKLSTSRGNVIWAKDLTTGPAALADIRMRLASSCPEYAPKEYLEDKPGASAAVATHPPGPSLTEAAARSSGPEVAALHHRLTALAEIEAFSVEDLLNVYAKGAEHASRLRSTHPQDALDLDAYLDAMGRALILA
jgi:methionyl-tRNA synthetase